MCIRDSTWPRRSSSRCRRRKRKSKLATEIKQAAGKPAACFFNNVWSLPLNGLHYSYLGNLFAKPLLDSHFQRHLGHWATSASTRQLDPDCAFIGHFYKFQVASILLQGGPYSFQSIFYSFTQHHILSLIHISEPTR